MRLLITLDFPPEHGGIQRHLAGIVAHTFTEDDAVYVGCGKALKGRGPAPGFPCPVTYVSTPFSRVNKKWSLLPLLVRCAGARRKRGRTLAIECGNVYAGMVPWLMSLVMPAVRYSVYAHGTELIGLEKASPAAILLKQVLMRADRIIANSAFTASLVHRICPTAPNVDIVYPKIDCEPSLSSSPRTANGGATAILCVGRLVRHKGHDILLEAVSRLPADSQWSLVVAGEGPLLESLTRRCRSLGIDGRVRFKTGMSDKELEQEYGRASLFVLPTVPVRGTEGFGIVLLEAMTRRLPIIASNTGGIAEVLDNGSCGVLVAPGDPAALRDAILRVAADKPLRERLASAALERLRNRYAWQ